MKKLTRFHCLKIMEWCKKEYGRSRYNGRYPDLEFKKGDYYVGEDWGYFDNIDNLIFINSDKHSTIEELANTVIHEYTHYKQSMHHYAILGEYLEPHDNPLEKQAEFIAQRDYKKCLKELSRYHKQFQ